MLTLATKVIFHVGTVRDVTNILALYKSLKMQAGKNPEPRKQTKNISFFTYPIEGNLFLHKPNMKPKTLFLDVLSARKSERNFSKLSITKIGNILWYSAKVKKVVSTHKGYILTTR